MVAIKLIMAGLMVLAFAGNLAAQTSYTARDVVHENIDVFAQKSLQRMLKGNPSEQADASGMITAVRTKELRGIFKEDQRVPSMWAQKQGLGWWNLIPQSEDAALVLDPADPDNNPPIIVFRDSIRSVAARLDPALIKAWSAYKTLRGGTVRPPASVPQPASGPRTEQPRPPAPPRPGGPSAIGECPEGYTWPLCSTRKVSGRIYSDADVQRLKAECESFCRETNSITFSAWSGGEQKDNPQCIVYVYEKSQKPVKYRNEKRKSGEREIGEKPFFNYEVECEVCTEGVLYFKKRERGTR